MAIGHRLTWQQFLQEAVGHSPEAFGIAELKGLVERLDLSPDLFAGHTNFCQEAYSRNLLFKNACFEAVCLCWQGEQRTSIHNHGRSFGVAVVYQGAMREEIFRREGDRVVRVRTDEVVPGVISSAPVGLIHRLGNAGGAGSRMVSLHFYAGPLDEMDVFDEETGTVTRKQMRYLSDGELPPTS